jgi:nucleoside phosphorylase
MNQPIFIFGALREEINQIRKQMFVKEQLKLEYADIWVGSWEGASIYLIRTGMGKKLALSAMKKVLSRTVPALVISIGYAGGLDSRLKAGDLIVADQVLDLNEKTSVSKSFPVNQQQLDLFQKLTFQKKIMVYRGVLITVNQVITASSDKQELGESHKALAVDMETSSLIAHAIEKNIPFFSLRAISDTMEQSLINISPYVDNQGKVSKIKAGWYAAKHPNIIKKFIYLRSQSQKATVNLTEGLSTFLRVL